MDYQQGTALTVLALRAAAGQNKASQDLQYWIDTTRVELQQLQGSRRHGDTYGRRLRRLAALAQAHALLLDDTHTSDELLTLALNTSEKNFGLAGFQFAANLALNETFLVCQPMDTTKAQQALNCALEFAQNINDTSFCARSTARVNAIQHRWISLSTEDLIRVIEQLRRDPNSPEFSTIHLIGQKCNRDPSARPMDSSFIAPNTLADLTRAYNQPPEEWERLNLPLGLTLKSSLIGVPIVNVPDPGFATFLASRFSAFVLCNNDLNQDKKIDLLQKLVPVSASNPTNLDIVLGRLLIVACPIIPDVLQMLDEITSPYLPLVEDEIEQIDIPA